MPPLIINSKADLDSLRQAQHCDRLLDAALDEAERALQGEARALFKAGKFQQQAIWWRSTAIVGLGCAFVLAVALVWLVRG